MKTKNKTTHFQAVLFAILLLVQKRRSEPRRVVFNEPVGDDPKMLFELVMQAVARHGRAPAISYLPWAEAQEPVTVTYHEFGDQLLQAAKALWARGIRPEHRVLIVGDMGGVENPLALALSILAANGCGATVAAIPENYGAKDLAHILGKFKPHFIIMAHPSVAGKLVTVLKDESMREVVETLTKFGIVSSTEVAPQHREEFQSWNLPFMSWDDLMFEGNGIPEFVPPHVDPHEVKYIQFTSGTTGGPKGAMHSNWSIVSCVLRTATAAPMPPGLVFGVYLRFTHIFGLTVDFLFGLHAGAHLNLVWSRAGANLIKEFQRIKPEVIIGVPAPYLEIVKVLLEKRKGLERQSEEGATFKERLIAKLMLWISARAKASAQRRLKKSGPVHVALRPWTPWGKLLDTLVYQKLRDAIGGRVAFCICGGGGISPEVMEIFALAGIALRLGWGQTEAPVECVNRVDELVIGSSGFPIVGADFRISEEGEFGEEDGMPSKAGEILVHSPSMMCGYLDDPERTARTIVQGKDGKLWLRTGDRGRIDEHGAIHVLGRIKRDFKLENGKWCEPDKMEEEFNALPFVQASCVGGILPDGVSAERPYVIVFAKGEGGANLLAALRTHGTSVEELFPNNAPFCEDSGVAAFVLGHLQDLQKSSGQFPPYCVVGRVIVANPALLVSREDFLTPSMKLKPDAVQAFFGDELRRLHQKEEAVA